MDEVQTPSTLAELCEYQAREHGERLAVADGLSSATYCELAAAAARVANALSARGIDAGDRVVLSAPNSLDWVVIAFGVLGCGAALVPVNHRLTGTERQRVLDVVGPTLVVGEPADWDLGQASTAVQRPEWVVRQQHSSAPTAPPRVDPSDTALIMHTSGTTGAARFVPMRHGPLLRLYADLAPRTGVGPGDLVLGVVPLFHGFGFFGVLLDALLTGAAVRLVPEYDRTMIAGLVTHDTVTAIFGPYAVFHDLLTGGLAEHHHACRVALTGGAEVSLPRFRDACSRLGVRRLFMGYGMTEAYGSVAFADVTGVDDDVAAMDVLPGVESRVVDALGHRVGEGQEGEILVRGESVMHGYLDDEDGGDGGPWLHTGDLGRTDSQGRLSVLSRIKDTIIVSGFNVVPAEVEEVLESDSRVHAAAVVGIPDSRSGEQLVGCVVVGPDAPGEQELIALSRRRLPGFKVPAHVLFLNEMPTTASGKLARTLIRERAQELLRGSPPT